MFERIAIVKTSSLGDIIQSLPVIDALKSRFPQAKVDWIVDSSLESVVAAHPAINQTIPVDLKGIKTQWRSRPYWACLIRQFKRLRQTNYDLLFDLQANTKSALITWAARAVQKVGFGYHSVREKPNVLATDLRYEVPKHLNIRLQHLQLLDRFFNDGKICSPQGVRFHLTHSEQQKVLKLLQAAPTSFKILVCPGSKWVNKQLPLETLSEVLLQIGQTYQASFFLVWGSSEEKDYCQALQARIGSIAFVVEKLPLATWQNLMASVDLVIAVDSSALHLCGTTSTPSFSLFGPTASEVFKPIGSNHYSLQGSCPYGTTFLKTCPVLRTCPTGACIRQLTAQQIFEAFERFYSSWCVRSINKS